MSPLLAFVICATLPEQYEATVLLQMPENSLLIALQNARDKLKTTSDSINQLNRQVIALSPAKSDPISALLLTQTQQQLFQQQSVLKEKVTIIESGIAEQRLYKTTAIEPIQVSTSPVYPKTGLAVFIALLIGGSAGAIVAFLRNALKIRRTQLFS